MMSPDEWLLRKLSRKPGTADYTYGTPVDGGFAQDPLVWLRAVFPEFEASVRGKRIADFGCGEGAQAIALARTYDCRVVGIDNNPRCLADAVKSAREQQLDGGQVDFRDCVAPDLFGTFDVVISQNAMEHYTQPDDALQTMRRMVRPGGQIMLTFGPPWFAPWGAHMLYFCRVPWVHLLFREKTVLSVRASYRAASPSYEECGLNRMSLRKFETLLSAAGLKIDYIKYHGVRGQDWVNEIPLARELLINMVTCLLTRMD
jgi:ubiquinone/menaquinone biosynthesis C-methylase UbiE